jgi:hypothetical protein
MILKKLSLITGDSLLSTPRHSPVPPPPPLRADPVAVIEEEDEEDAENEDSPEN